MPFTVGKDHARIFCGWETIVYNLSNFEILSTHFTKIDINSCNMQETFDYNLIMEEYSILRYGKKNIFERKLIDYSKVYPNYRYFKGWNSLIINKY